MKLYFIHALLLSLVLFCSCANSTGDSMEEHENERTKSVDVSLTSIDDDLPPCHNYSELKIIGDTLIIINLRSTDKLFYAYDLKMQRGLGWFGKFGGGPGELSNFSGKVINPNTHTIYGTDFGTFERKKIDIRKALADSTYGAETIRNIDVWKDGYFKEAYFINDSIVYTCLKQFDGSSKLVKYNINSEFSIPIDTIENHEQSNSLIIVAHDSQLLMRVYHSYDKIRIYSFEGNLKKIIYGPDYKEQWDGRTRFFGSGVVGKDEQIYVLYNGQEIPKHYPQDILVMDKDGRYLKTLHLNSFVWDIAYHKPTNRLYVSTDGEPQFGYINLSDYDL